MRYILIVFIFLFFNNNTNGQGCCSGSSGNPMAGGLSTGVLQEKQIEISTNYQYTFSEKFFAGKNDTTNLFDNLNSNYLFLRTEYGLTKKLTLSLSAGYYLNKSQIGGIKPNSSSGFGDLIVFPRFNIYNKDMPFSRLEATIGVGLKIPVGTHRDSSLIIPAIDYWEINPPITQLSSGSYDLLLYSFFLKDFKLNKLKFFSSIFHIKKGYNSLEQKMGNYTSIALNASRMINKNINITTQIKGENITKMIAGNVWNKDELEFSSGSKKLFFTPLISYRYENLGVFISYELPIYQNINGVQIGSQNKITIGINYSFKENKEKTSEIY